MVMTPLFSPPPPFCEFSTLPLPIIAILGLMMACSLCFKIFTGIESQTFSFVAVIFLSILNPNLQCLVFCGSMVFMSVRNV